MYGRKWSGAFFFKWWSEKTRSKFQPFRSLQSSVCCLLCRCRSAPAAAPAAAFRKSKNAWNHFLSAMFEEVKGEFFLFLFLGKGRTKRERRSERAKAKSDVFFQPRPLSCRPRAAEVFSCCCFGNDDDDGDGATSARFLFDARPHPFLHRPRLFYVFFLFQTPLPSQTGARCGGTWPATTRARGWYGTRGRGRSCATRSRPRPRRSAEGKRRRQELESLLLPRLPLPECDCSGATGRHRSLTLRSRPSPAPAASASACCSKGPTGPRSTESRAPGSSSTHSGRRCWPRETKGS